MSRTMSDADLSPELSAFVEDEKAVARVLAHVRAPHAWEAFCPQCKMEQPCHVNKVLALLAARERRLVDLTTERDSWCRQALAAQAEPYVTKLEAAERRLGEVEAERKKLFADYGIESDASLDDIVSRLLKAAIRQGRQIREAETTLAAVRALAESLRQVFAKNRELALPHIDDPREAQAALRVWDCIEIIRRHLNADLPPYVPMDAEIRAALTPPSADGAKGTTHAKG